MREQIGIFVEAIVGDGLTEEQRLVASFDVFHDFPGDAGRVIGRLIQFEPEMLGVHHDLRRDAQLAPAHERKNPPLGAGVRREQAEHAADQGAELHVAR